MQVFEQKKPVKSGVVYRGTWNQMEVALKVMKNTENIIPRPAVSIEF